MLALLGALVPNLDRSELAVARCAERASGAAIAPGELVWDASDGLLADFVIGRRLWFLGRTTKQSPRDLFDVRVHLTPGGAPLFGREARRVIDTALADERELRVTRERAAVLSDGGNQGITALWFERGAMAATQARIPSELAGVAGDLRLELDGVRVLVGAARGEPVDLVALGREETRPVVLGPRADAPVPAPEMHLGSTGTSDFPPRGFTSPDAHAAFVEGRAPDAWAVALDGRLLEFTILPGTRSPHFDTGAFAGSPAIDPSRIVAAWPVPDEGPRGQGRWLGASLGRSDEPRAAWSALGLGPAGELGLGPLESFAESARWPTVLPLGAKSRPGVTALCATSGGSLVIAAAKAAIEPAASSWLGDCALQVVLPGEAAAVLVGDAARARAAAPDLSALLVAATRSEPPRLVGLPESAWAPLEAGAASPAWIPSIARVELEELGTRVDLYRIEASRFEWTIVPGADERAHRLGGTFERALASADQPRARLSLGLATGKRRATSGLRTRGSTGLRFRGLEAALGVETGGDLVVGRARDLELASDEVTELPVTVEDNQLRTAARERGPVQPRADLCVLDDGRVLAAFATFDSHEPTAAVLARAGCRRAVALDRGTERPAWVRFGAEAAGPFDDTALVALDRPMMGRVIASARPSAP